MPTRLSLLPPEALNEICLGISISQSADLERLGVVEEHLRIALGEIARCVLVSGGTLGYGGHLAPGGYTNFLIQEVYRYARRDKPLHICLAWSEHRKLALSSLASSERDLGLFGKIICLDPDGQPVDRFVGRDEL